MRVHLEEIGAIGDATEPPSFDNTVAALDRAGRLFDRISGLFYNLTSSETSPALQAVEREMAPLLAAHDSRVYMHRALFARIDALHGRRHELGLGDEQLRVLERYHTDFVRAGARMDGVAQKRYAEVMQRLADLTTRFGQNVLADESGFQLVLRSDADFAGLPDFVRAAARQAASERGVAGAGVITLSRSHIVPFLTFSERRDLREQAWRAWTSRGEHPGASDNRGIAAEILAPAPRAGPAARLRVVCRLRARRHHGRHAGGGDLAADAGVAAGDRPGRGRARGARGARPLARRAGDDRALGLALLRREGAPGPLCARRGRGQALLPAGAHHRGGVRLRRAPVRPELRRPPRDRGLSPGREGLRGARRRRRADRPVPARQLRPADQAQRRLDELVPAAVEERRQPRRCLGAADHRQQQQLRQGRARRADAAQLRRRPNALPRVRPRPARAALERHLRAALGHQRAARLRRAAVAAVRALARGARGAQAPCPAPSHRPADSRRAGREAARGAPLQPGLRDRPLHRLGAGRHGGARPRRLGRGRRRRLRARRARADRPAGRRRPEPSPDPLPAPVLGLGLRGRLLRLPVGRGARRRRLRGLRRGRQPVRRGRRQAAVPLHLFVGQLDRAGRRLPRLPRPGADAASRCSSSAAWSRRARRPSGRRRPARSGSASSAP